MLFVPEKMHEVWLRDGGPDAPEPWTEEQMNQRPVLPFLSPILSRAGGRKAAPGPLVHPAEMGPGKGKGGFDFLLVAFLVDASATAVLTDRRALVLWSLGVSF